MTYSSNHAEFCTAIATWGFYQGSERDRSGEPFVRLPIQDGSRPYLLKPWREAVVMFAD